MQPISMYNIEKSTVERLTKFCEEFGGNKSVTTDKALNMCLDEMKEKLKTSK